MHLHIKILKQNFSSERRAKFCLNIYISRIFYDAEVVLFIMEQT